MNLLMDTSKQAERFPGTALPNDISMDEQISAMCPRELPPLLHVSFPSANKRGGQRSFVSALEKKTTKKQNAKRKASIVACRLPCLVSTAVATAQNVSHILSFLDCIVHLPSGFLIITLICCLGFSLLFLLLNMSGLWSGLTVIKRVAWIHLAGVTRGCLRKEL